MGLNWVDIAVIGAYLLGVTLFGLRFRGRQRTLRDYFLADNAIPWWAISLSIVAAETSTLTVISVPGLAYERDFRFLQLVVGYLAGRVIVSLVFIPQYFRGDLVTAYQLIEKRFGQRLRSLTAGLFLITRAVAEGIRVFAVAIVVGIALSSVLVGFSAFGRDLAAIGIVTLLTLIYTFEGGLAAVIWTDIIQLTIYLAGSVVGGFILLHLIPGGWISVERIAGDAHKFRVLDLSWSLFNTYTLWSGVIGGAFLTMASHGTDQLVVQRLLAARSERQSKVALLASGVAILLQFSLFLLLGVMLFVFYRSAPPATPFLRTDTIFPTFVVTRLPHGVSGLLIAAILAAAMSNLSAALNSLSSTTIVDFYTRLRPNVDERRLVRLSRLVTVGWGLLLFVLAILARNGGKVIEVGLSIASVAYGPLLGACLPGVLTRRASEDGATCGMVAGFALSLYLWLLTRVSFTWYVVFGSIVTFVLGYAPSRVLPRRARVESSSWLRHGIFSGVVLLALLWSFSSPAWASKKHLPRTANRSGEAPGFKALDSLLEQAVADKNIPGAVVLVGHDGKVVYRRAFGFRSLEPDREPMTIDTVFDLASLTKCIVTATSVMQLVEQGRLRLNDPVSAYLPDFAANGKRDLTLRELLTHFSGLRPDLDLQGAWSGRDAAFKMAMEETPIHPPGSRFLYSDINFEVLGFLVERVTGQPLNHYAQQHIFAPLHMTDTRYLPPTSWLPRTAPTEYDEDGRMLRGVVHDPTARRMGGVAGHAGLFSTGDDLARYAQDLLNGHKLLSASSIAKMSTPQQPAMAASLRGLGWDIDSPFAGNRGELLPVGSFGHTGFTGTSLWIDPATDTYIILLTNAVHPHIGKSVTSLRARLATAVVGSLKLTVSEAARLQSARITGYNESMMAARRLDVRNGSVKTGVDTLEIDGFRELHPDPTHPVRVGLVSNQTAVDASGRRTADVLSSAPGIRLAAIFSPEHGVAGVLDTANIGDAYDEATKAPVYSVYGDTDAKRRPTAAALKDLDAIVYDIQDVGVRFYTYESTLGYFLEAAARAGKPIVVLDRPNPVNGSYVQGPVADAGSESFVSYWRTPIRHGMTIGELARMFNQERKIDAKLTVVPMRGWMRGDWFDSTGNLWINPSPNMRSLTEAVLYPGVGMVETTNISVGRGTDTPFEVIGAPWIDPVPLASYLNARELSGVRFVPIHFTPKSSVYANQPCGGVNLVLTDRDALDSPELGLEIASALRTLYPDHYEINGMDTLTRNKATLAAAVAGRDPSRIAEEWREDIESFLQVRAKYLLY